MYAWIYTHVIRALVCIDLHKVCSIITAYTRPIVAAFQLKFCYFLRKHVAHDHLSLTRTLTFSNVQNIIYTNVKWQSLSATHRNVQNLLENIVCVKMNRDLVKEIFCRRIKRRRYIWIIVLTAQFNLNNRHAIIR